MSKFMEGQKRIGNAVVSGYQKIEDTVVSGYKKIEDGVVGGYKKVEDAFVKSFLTPEESSSRREAQSAHAQPSYYSSFKNGSKYFDPTEENSIS